MDNAFAISYGAMHSPLSPFYGPLTKWLPVYRPLPYSTIVIEYALFGLNPVHFLAVNLLIWILCGCCVYILVTLLTQSRIVALFLALAMLLDPRSNAALYWIAERQSSMALLFGLLAMIIILVPWRDNYKRITWFGIFFLLLSAALCKEYGLSFCAGSFILLFLTKDKSARPLQFIILAVLVSYGLMRVMTRATRLQDYCTTMGAGTSVAEVCYSQLTGNERIMLYMYNEAATLVGTMAPKLFGFFGSFAMSSFTLGQTVLMNGIFICFACVALVKKPALTFSLASIIFFNALLSFALYRERNQIVGLSAFYIIAGIGAATLINHGRYRFIKGAVPLLIVLMIFARNTATNFTIVRQFVAQSGQYNICDTLTTHAKDDLSLEIIDQLNRLYQSDMPSCENQVQPTIPSTER
jgi:hypothetical protein